MKIRWLWGNYIEPEWKLSRPEVREVHRIVKKRHVRPAALFGLTAAWLAIMLAALKLLHLPAIGLLGSLGLWSWHAWMIGMAMIILPLMVLAIWTFRWVYTKPVRMAMRELGYDVCPGCGYWLRGLDDRVQHCPECGMKKDALRSGVADPQFRQ